MCNVVVASQTVGWVAGLAMLALGCASGVGAGTNDSSGTAVAVPALGGGAGAAGASGAGADEPAPGTPTETGTVAQPGTATPGSGVDTTPDDTGTAIPETGTDTPPTPVPSAPATATTPTSSTPLPSNGTNPSMLPQVNGSCPTLVNGPVNVTVGGVSNTWNVWMGSPTADQHGPVIIYWHGTGTDSSEAVAALGNALDETVAAGGIVAAPEVTAGTGANTGDLVWFTGDVDFADQIVACAIQQLHTDPRRIYTAGYSAGGLQTVYMWYARSGYLASAVSFSGGDAFINAAPLQDPSYLPPAIAAHGAPGSDVLILDFASASDSWEQTIKGQNGFVIDCNDGGAHIDVLGRFQIGASGAVWAFFKDHPYRGDASWTSLPATFPSICKIL